MPGLLPASREISPTSSTSTMPWTPHARGPGPCLRASSTSPRSLEGSRQHHSCPTHKLDFAISLAQQHQQGLRTSFLKRGTGFLFLGMASPRRANGVRASSYNTPSRMIGYKRTRSGAQHVGSSARLLSWETFSMRLVWSRLQTASEDASGRGRLLAVCLENA